MIQEKGRGAEVGGEVERAASAIRLFSFASEDDGSISKAFFDAVSASSYLPSAISAVPLFIHASWRVESSEAARSDASRLSAYLPSWIRAYALLFHAPD